jgi:hypothetical protein
MGGGRYGTNPRSKHRLSDPRLTISRAGRSQRPKPERDSCKRIAAAQALRANDLSRREFWPCFRPLFRYPCGRGQRGLIGIVEPSDMGQLSCPSAFIDPVRVSYFEHLQRSRYVDFNKAADPASCLVSCSPVRRHCRDQHDDSVPSQ